MFQAPGKLIGNNDYAETIYSPSQLLEIINNEGKKYILDSHFRDIKV